MPEASSPTEKPQADSQASKSPAPEKPAPPAEKPALEDKGPRSYTQAEVLELLYQGKTVRDARIGALDLRGITLPAAMRFLDCTFAALELSHLEVEGAADFDGCRFTERAFIKRCRFKDQATFRWATFEKGADFSGTSFSIKTHFNSARFQRWTSFQEAEFNGRTVFSKAWFPNGVDFSRSVYRSPEPVEAGANAFSFNNISCNNRFHMQRCRFEDNVTFSGARFGEITDFEGTVFARTLRVKHAQFLRKVSFKSVAFRGETHFNGSSVDGDLVYHSAIFAGLVNLNSMYAQRNVDFHNAVMEADATFQIRHAYFGRLLLGREQIENHLASLREPDYQAAREEFGLLKNSFKEVNEYELEDWSYLMEKRMERLAVPLAWGEPRAALKRLLNWLALDLACGYGTRPISVLVTAFVLLGVFAAIYTAGAGQFDPEYLTESGYLSPFDALQLSFRVFTNAEVSSAEPRATSWLNHVMMVESFMGLFVMMVLVVTYSRKVIR